jgi:hypothetical protein
MGRKYRLEDPIEIRVLYSCEDEAHQSPDEDNKEREVVAFLEP